MCHLYFSVSHRSLASASISPTMRLPSCMAVVDQAVSSPFRSASMEQHCQPTWTAARRACSRAVFNARRSTESVGHWQERSHHCADLPLDLGHRRTGNTTHMLAGGHNLKLGSPCTTYTAPSFSSFFFFRKDGISSSSYSELHDGLRLPWFAVGVQPEAV